MRAISLSKRACIGLIGKAVEKTKTEKLKNFIKKDFHNQESCVILHRVLGKGGILYEAHQDIDDERL